MCVQVPNLFPKDELSSVLDDVRAAAKAAGAGETGEQVRESTEGEVCAGGSVHGRMCMEVCAWEFVHGGLCMESVYGSLCMGACVLW